MTFFIQKIVTFYNTGNRWYLPMLAGFFFVLAAPPINGQLHPALTLFPLLSFIVCLPLFAFSLNVRSKRALIHTYLFGICASLGQLYWIAFVCPEGLWHLIILGVALLTLFEGLFFAINGLVFRWTFKKFPRLYFLMVPAWWVIVEYCKSLGEMSFPWTTIGYSLTPLSISQVSSITGIYGMSFIIILGNVLIWHVLRGPTGSKERKNGIVAMVIFAALLSAASLWGFSRLHSPQAAGPTAKVALVQPCIDQNHWGNRSLDTSFNVIESMVDKAAVNAPNVIILPESALLCYLVKRSSLKNRVVDWSKKIKIPMVLGSLDWQNAPPKSSSEYYVYNAAFFLDSGSSAFQPYYKVKLVPFSEALPFQGLFPILSRVNLGQADFKPGSVPVVYSIGSLIRGAPFICFDIIYPSFVRKRAAFGANILIHITNDGWFGKSSGPFQHALMSQQRCIENGISLARCANSGISMLVDQYGRIIAKTRLGVRTILSGDIPLARVPTLYTALGDWPVGVSACIAVVQLCIVIFRRYVRKKETQQ
jgi:apolipoprotein N-acyltransferase